MLSDIMIGAKDFKSSTDMIRNSSIDLILNDDVKVYISSYNDLPLLWEKDYGKAPYSHAELSTFKAFTTRLGFDLEKSKEIDLIKI